MYGSLLGNTSAIFYFLIYQFFGLLLSDFLFNKEKKSIRCLIGSVIGSFLLMWLPAIASMIMGFNTTSHIIALVFLLIILLCVSFYMNQKKQHIKLMVFDIKLKDILYAIRNNWIFIILFVSLTVFFASLLNNHVLAIGESGIYTGQCTFGDMNMHLGFITSIANQGTFPPEYSIMPGNLLAYPFLCDSVSSSLYVFGSSLKLAYCLPMVFAFMQVLGGFYAFAGAWLKDKAKVLTSFVLFFFNGGLGILYFTEDIIKFFDKLGWDFIVNVLNKIVEAVGNVSYSTDHLLTAFYNTPTNLVDYNIRWVNVIADMLLPQRATLFGWSILFTVLYILWRAHFEGKTNYFYTVGVLAGGMVMIHTHSFLALGIICAVWLMYYLVDLIKCKFKINRTSNVILRIVIILATLAVLNTLREYEIKYENVKDLSDLWFNIGIVGVVLFAASIISCLVVLIKRKQIMPVLKSWGVFLAVVLPLALFQLITWTLKQAKGDRFVRGEFNWSNVDDSYLMFYIKNIGIILFVILLALAFSKRKMFRLAMSGVTIWLIAEFLGFQPNPYDNNKLLYVGFVFLIIPAASLLVDVCRKIKFKVLTYGLLICFLCICSISAFYTLKREYVSGYVSKESQEKYFSDIDLTGDYVFIYGIQLYSNEYVGLVDYINSPGNVPADAVILTNNNHNNAISSLTGRNIVVGSGSFLHYHGFDINERVYHVRSMFEDPEENAHLFEKYNVEYVVIGSFESSSYDIDYDWYRQHAEVLCESQGAYLLELKN